MTAPAGVRKIVLTAHVTSSVGWLGAVLAFLALAVVGVTSRDREVVRAVSLTAEAVVDLAVLPLALASLVSGVAGSLATTWGLVRHYWVVVKLVLTAASTVVLLAYTGTVSAYADLAAEPGVPAAQLRAPTFVVHSAAAVVVLLAATTLGVYKPRGLTPFGSRRGRGRAGDL